MDYAKSKLQYDGNVRLPKLSDFISTTKPGIIFGNSFTFLAGFFLTGSDNLYILLLSLLGMSLVMASGCVFNNCIDKDIDAFMKRTCDRVFVRKILSLKTGIIYGSVLGLLGFAILFKINYQAFIAALVGFVFYVFLYSFYFKRSTIYGVIVGAVSGAIPPVVGYLAVNSFDFAAFSLFTILFFWQLPHSFAIAIYRNDDYSNAFIPTLPRVRGIFYTKLNIIIYSFFYLFSLFLPVIFGYISILYLIFNIPCALFWIIFGVYKFNSNQFKWAKNMFMISILNIMIFSFSIIILNIFFKL